MKLKISKKLLPVVGLALIICYGGYQIYSVTHRPVKTEIAINMAISETINAEGIIIRKESKVYAEESVVTSIALNDGDRVAKSGVIAEVYRSEDEHKRALRLQEIDRETKRLTSLSGIECGDPISMDKQVTNQAKRLLIDCNRGEYSKLSRHRVKLLDLLMQRNIITGKPTGISARIESLSKERSALLRERRTKLHDIFAATPGYFVGYIDGYEDMFRYEDTPSITLQQIDGLFESSPAEVEKGKKVIGKLVSGVAWYIVFKLPPESVEKVKNSEYIDITLPSCSFEKMSAKLVSINSDTSSGSASVVLSCNVTNKNLLGVRKEPICLDTGHHDGIKVKKSAIHKQVIKRETEDENGDSISSEKSVTGVYILRGKHLVFKEISIIFSDNDWVLCDKCPEKGSLFNGESIKEYDQVVVEGADLYDGKIIK